MLFMFVYLRLFCAFIRKGRNCCSVNIEIIGCKTNKNKPIVLHTLTMIYHSSPFVIIYTPRDKLYFVLDQIPINISKESYVYMLTFSPRVYVSNTQVVISTFPILCFGCIDSQFWAGDTWSNAISKIVFYPIS